MMEDDLTYNTVKDIWINNAGNEFIKNEFDPNCPIFIKISSEKWSASYNGSIFDIDWKEININYQLKDILKKVISEKLKHCAASYLSKSKQTLIQLSSVLSPECCSLEYLTIIDLSKIWLKLLPTNRSYFREWYRVLAHTQKDSTSLQKAREMESWNAREDILNLRDVLNWHETRGALTSEEEFALRAAIRDYHNSKPNEIALHIYCWLLLDTLKRPTQVLQMRANALKVTGNEYFVAIKPIKAQTGLDVRWWRIPNELADAIQFYSSHKQVIDLQKKYNRLIVWDTPSLINHGQIDARIASSALKLYLNRKIKLISPRTGKLLHIKPTRIRHTGATRLAFSNVPRDLIQEILEHDSPVSAQAYIDAICSELAPQIEKADRNMGSLFYKLNHAFFNGNLINKVEKQPIVIPEHKLTNLIVGACGKDTVRDGKCEKHPFISCYNGCPSFLAWKEADHRKAMIYIEQEINRWEKALGHEKQNASLKEYFDVKKAIQEVIDLIESDKREEIK